MKTDLLTWLRNLIKPLRTDNKIFDLSESKAFADDTLISAITDEIFIETMKEQFNLYSETTQGK